MTSAGTGSDGNGHRFKVAAFYKFVALGDCTGLQSRLLDYCRRHEIRGTILLAGEGINGTVAGLHHDIDALISHLRNDTSFASRFDDLEVKFSFATMQPFHRMKVRLKQEIVSLRAPEADPTKRVGTYVPAEDWNKLISEPDVVVVDVRNDYEVAIGSFAGAINPNTASFTQFKDFVGERLKPKRDTRIAMFCTGGIRCEKASAYLLAHGIEEVYHLKGGILTYLEVVPEEASLWQGACFVFDERVGVSHGLAVSDHILCRACRRPLSSEDCAHGDYIEGAQCAYCRDERTAAQKESAAERHRQVAIAESRGKTHIGCEAEVARRDAGASASGEKVSRRG